MSFGTPVDSIPKWQTYPVLRLAQVLRVGATCRILGLASAKLDFGTSALANPAFSAGRANDWVDSAAGYIVCGRFSANLGSAVVRDPRMFDATLRFRDSASRRDLRKTILAGLASGEGAEVNAAINSALRTSIPSEILESAGDEFLRLSLSQNMTEGPRVAVWTDKRAEDAIAAWRRRSRRILDDWAKRIRADPYGTCPCGSGDKFRFCCDGALREKYVDSCAALIIE
jgi:hypothetical protein